VGERPPRAIKTHGFKMRHHGRIHAVHVLWQPRAQFIGHLAHHLAFSLVSAGLTLAHDAQSGGVVGAVAVVSGKAGRHQPGVFHFEVGLHGADQGGTAGHQVLVGRQTHLGQCGDDGIVVVVNGLKVHQQGVTPLGNSKGVSRWGHVIPAKSGHHSGSIVRCVDSDQQVIN
jgi:hypothetical protein